MPELPEVETIVRSLQKSIINCTIVKIKISKQLLRAPYPTKLKATLKNKRITTVTRRAKYIILHINSKHKLIMHLGMSGNIILISDSCERSNQHDHAIFYQF